MATKNKRLTRTEKNRLLGGVCAGLGKFFGLDATLIRLIFIFITLFGGSGILFYLILWLIIPSESSSGEVSEENIKKGAKEMQTKAEALADSAKNFSEHKHGRYLWGIILLTLGLVLLFNNFGFFRYFNLFRLWPLALIVLAILMLTKNDRA